MKCLHNLLVSLVVSALMISPQLVSAQAGDEAAVARAVEAWRKAVLAKDRNQFEVLLADQLTYGHSDGRVETKTQWIDGVTGPRVVWTLIELTNQTIQVAGNTAIVRHDFTGERERGRKIGMTKLAVMMVWQNQDGRWKLLARQAFRREVK